MPAAPYFAEVAGALEPLDVRWLAAADGVRLRAAAWPGSKCGTVLLFSGRTEYLEKYARIAQALSARGLATASIDWRGQGLSDRALPDMLTGHVADFRDYQLDVAALRDFAIELGLPRPFYMIAHSMGGAIALRALHRGLDVEAVTFSAPMWGIEMPRMARPLAWSVSWLGHALGRGHRYTPGTGAAHYVTETAFETNLLTRDPEMFAWMQNQTRAHPELSLGGPSLSWLFGALREMRSLRAAAPPPYPALTFLGSSEAIVDPVAIRSLMRRWRNGTLEIIQGARHEVMMEVPAVRARFLDAAAKHFSQARECRAA